MNRCLDEMSCEGRLLVLLGKVAIFNPVLERQTFVTSRFSQRNAAVTQTHFAIGKLNIGRVEAQLLGDGLSQLQARGVNACGGVIGAPLAARASRNREALIAQQHDYLFQRHAHHLSGGLRDDGVGAGADVGHVGLYRHHAITA